MPQLARFMVIGLAMMSFAGNSLLNRIALSSKASDPASFTLVRLMTAALMLAIMVQWQRSAKKPVLMNTAKNPSKPTSRSNIIQRWLPWFSALALFIYAAGFSWAYNLMTAATGALILFGAVQLTMILAALAQGEKLDKWQWLGFCVALLGMVQLTLPTFSTPSGISVLAMLLAGVAFGVYSLIGRQAVHPLRSTSANFLRTLPLAALLGIAQYPTLSMTINGFIYASLSGAVTSGIGYAMWYRVLPTLGASKAAGIQLCVPVLTILTGAVFLQEPVTTPVITACATILGGMVLVLRRKKA